MLLEVNSYLWSIINLEKPLSFKFMSQFKDYEAQSMINKFGGSKQSTSAMFDGF